MATWLFLLNCESQTDDKKNEKAQANGQAWAFINTTKT
jgi:hypothetical protein